MPSGSLPKYKYVPPFRPGTEAQLRTCSSRRSRLWAGGTYFRVREPGIPGNLCTVEVFAYTPAEAYCRITNTGLLYSENVTGAECGVDLLEYDSKVSGEFQDLYELYDLDTTPRARKYSISLRISFARQEGQPFTLPTPEELGEFTFGKLFVSGKISVQLTKKSSPYASGDRIFIAPRTRLYSLSALTVTPLPDPTTGVAAPPETGYDIADLRTKVNASNPWVEMKERTPVPAAPEGGGPAPSPSSYIDAQDKLQDALVLSAFTVRNLADGDGLPDNPNREKTGPSRSLCFVNYGEKPDGSLGELNTVYEWVGDSASAGSWKNY